MYPPRRRPRVSTGFQMRSLFAISAGFGTDRPPPPAGRPAGRARRLEAGSSRAEIGLFEEVPAATRPPFDANRAVLNEKAELTRPLLG
jgi:hypothetical protein